MNKENPGLMGYLCSYLIPIYEGMQLAKCLAKKKKKALYFNIYSENNGCTLSFKVYIAKE